MSKRARDFYNKRLKEDDSIGSVQLMEEYAKVYHQEEMSISHPVAFRTTPLTPDEQKAFKDAFEGINDSRPIITFEKDQWISVKDRLPQEYTYCLFWCPRSFPKNCHVLSGSFYDDNNTFVCDAHEEIHEDVTHWQPMLKDPTG